MQSWGGGGWGTWAKPHTESPVTATPSRCIALCLVEEQKACQETALFPHINTPTVKIGEASSLLLSFCLFSISHNTNQTARLPRPPNKSAVLLSLAAPAQGELWDGVPLRVQPHELLSLPALPARAPELGTAPKHREVAHTLPTQLLAWGHNQDHPAQATHLLYTAHSKSANTQIIRNFKTCGLTLSTWFATKSKA